MRLIDADALLDDFDKRATLCKHFAGTQIFFLEAKKVVNSAPTIEAEPVVHCKDCKKRRIRECHMCDYEQLWDDDDGWIDAYRDRTEDEGFCHKGAKMDGGAED